MIRNQIPIALTRFPPCEKKSLLHLKTLHRQSHFSAPELCQATNLNLLPVKTIQSPSYASILQGLKALKPLQQVHTRIITSGLAQNIFLSNRLMNSYASCGVLTVAEVIFQSMPSKNVVSWTILISGFSKHEHYLEALEIFRKMMISGVLPSAVTLASVFPAFVHLGMIKIGRSLHGFLIRYGLEINLFVETSLIDLYSKFGSIGVARKQFDMMVEKNMVSWNAIISGYSYNRFGKEAVQLFRMMQRRGLMADSITIMSLLAACMVMVCQQIVGLIHNLIVKNGFSNDMLVNTALMENYLKHRCINDAYQIFREELPVKDVVAWTSMLVGLSDAGYGKQAVRIFDEMTGTSNIMLDHVAFMCMLSCCSRSGALQRGKLVHSITIKTSFGDDALVGSATIDMYSNCGDLESAEKLFDILEEKDVVCWNAMIAGYGMQGRGDDAVALFFQMKCLGVLPDEATLVSILCACSHAGMVDQGIKIFDLTVKESCLVPTLQHYACLVDLLGRAGRLYDAYSLIHNMPLEPDAGIYGVMLGACKVRKNFELGTIISQKLFELDPDDAGYYVLLSNMYAAAGNWEGVKVTRVSMKSKGLKKIPGLSTIEIGREVHTFMAGDTDHPEYPRIIEALKRLITKIEAAGYMLDTRLVFQDLPDDAKREIILHHSEKLAIAFGIMNTKPGTTIRIIKNLRICDDCHIASKFISKVEGREIIMKDANRFHIFKDGICSCKDYW
ncbi:hypothetical protein Sjap_010144 [Stephania japonica]|uniref:DYW domain-containing protein n=1 Tax=Stephania japonica TaxID=461633 RepID=A0AAP0J8H7_9MAGN